MVFVICVISRYALFKRINFQYTTYTTEWWGAGVVICLGQGADLHMAQLMPLPLTISCSSKLRLVLPFQYWLTQVFAGRGPLNVCCCCCSCCCCYTCTTALHTFHHPVIVFFLQHTITTCFPVVLRLCHLILVSVSVLYLELYIVAEISVCVTNTATTVP